MKKSIFSALCLVLLATTTQSAWGATNGDVFKRIDSASELSDGDEIIFVNQAETYACGTKQNTNNRTPVSITTSNNAYTYTSSDNVQVFVVKVNGSNFGFHTGSGYIYSASSSSNNLRTNTTAASTLATTTSAWTISVSNYVFTIQNVSNKSYYLAFNSTTYFSQYKSGQSKPYIYKKSGSTPPTLYLGLFLAAFVAVRACVRRVECLYATFHHIIMSKIDFRSVHFAKALFFCFLGFVLFLSIKWRFLSFFFGEHVQICITSMVCIETAYDMLSHCRNALPEPLSPCLGGGVSG